MQNSLQSLSERLRDFAQRRDWEQFHSPKNLSMALIVEAAELVEHFQWITEHESCQLDAKKLSEIELELADIFIYLIRITDELEIDLLTAVEKKIRLNEQKYPVERVRGSHKKYTEYCD